MIYIFTISTGIYNTYLNTFIDSINNCFTNKEKTVVIIGDNEYKEKQNFNIYNYHIPLTNYSLCNLQIYIYIDDAIKYLKLNISENDYILYVDVDSYFEKRSIEYYDDLYNKFNEYDIILSVFPWDIDKNNLDVKQEYIVNLNTKRYTSINRSRFKNVIGAFFISKLNVFIKLKELVNLCLLYDLSIINVLDDHNNYRSFPEWQEQTYLNKIIQDNWINSDKICIDYYILNASQDFLNRMNLTYEEEKNIFKNYFIVKDYNREIKMSINYRHLNIHGIKKDIDNLINKPFNEFK